MDPGGLLVVIGLVFNPRSAKVAEFFTAAQGTDCRVLGCFEALQLGSDPEVLRVIATQYWDAGAERLYFFNDYRAF